MARVRLILWLALAGCSTPITAAPNCVTNSQCPGDQSCVEGACVVQCFLDRECDPGARCEFNRCVAPLADARPPEPDTTVVIDAAADAGADAGPDGAVATDGGLDGAAADAMPSTEDASGTPDAGPGDDTGPGAPDDGPAPDMSAADAQPADANVIIDAAAADMTPVDMTTADMSPGDAVVDNAGG